jgi:hypothetical protein
MNTAGEPFPLRRAANGEMEMNAQATKLQAAENDLKQLMADVSQSVKVVRSFGSVIRLSAF